jgi:hypothetical protein
MTAKPVGFRAREAQKTARANYATRATCAVCLASHVIAFVYDRRAAGLWVLYVQPRHTAKRETPVTVATKLNTYLTLLNHQFDSDFLPGPVIGVFADATSTQHPSRTTTPLIVKRENLGKNSDTHHYSLR